MATSSQARAHRRRLANVIRKAAEIMQDAGRATGVVLGYDGRVDVGGAIALALGWPPAQIEGLGMVRKPWTKKDGSVSGRSVKAFDQFEECIVLLNKYVDERDLARDIARFNDKARSKTQVCALLRKAANAVEVE